METIVLNHFESKLNKRFEALALKVGFLLSDCVNSVGTAYCDIYFEHYSEKKNTMEKVEFIEMFITKHPELEKDFSAADYKYAIKGLKQRGHMSQQDIVMKKRLDSAVNGMYETVKEIFSKQLLSDGLIQLKPISEKKEMGIFAVSLSEEEKDTEEYVPMSRVLMQKLPGAESPELFILPFEFFIPSFFRPDDIVSGAEHSDALSKSGYLQKCFEFPNINMLSATELEAIRAQLKPPGEAFRKQMDEWNLLSQKTSDAAETNRYFIEYILPAAHALFEAIERNELLRHLSRLQNDEVKTSVMVGELSLPLIWDFFKFAEVPREKSWNKLMEEKEKDISLNRRVPVIVLYNDSYSITSPAEHETGSDMKPVKKSISIN
ncbi:MAG TPA: hypothetical protein VI757_01185 [Bacteroidia bacterium]|nr:hypothetical protein [Bacteroidia bacterium]